MLRPAALQSALEALVSPTCNSALLALPESGSLYASASSDASSSTAPAAQAAQGSATSPSALMRGAPTAGVEALGTDERDRTLAAIGTQAWREESGVGGKNGRGAAATPTPGAPVLLDSELGATLIYPLRLPLAAIDSSAPIRRASSQEPTPPLLLILTYSAPPHQEHEHGDQEEEDAWADLMKRARAFEEHASPALVSAFRA